MLFNIITITLIVLLAVAPWLMISKTRDAYEKLEIEQAMHAVTKRTFDHMADRLDEELRTNERLFNQITLKNNELRHAREEISTLKGDINTLLLKNKLHSCQPDTIFDDVDQD